MREAAVNVAVCWFCGFSLTERPPDHSSLTRIRQRWGEQRFRRIFERTVQPCVAARIAKGEVVHIDASLIRADVSWETLATRWVEKVGTEDERVDEAERNTNQTGKDKKICTTDPDATMATSGRNMLGELWDHERAAIGEHLLKTLDPTDYGLTVEAAQ